MGSIVSNGKRVEVATEKPTYKLVDEGHGNAAQEEVAIEHSDTNQFVTTQRNCLGLESTTRPMGFYMERVGEGVRFYYTTTLGRKYITATKSDKLKMMTKGQASDQDRIFKLGRSYSSGKRLIQLLSQTKYAYFDIAGNLKRLALTAEERNAGDFAVVKAQT